MKLAVQTSPTNVSPSGRLTLETDLEEEGFITHAGISVAPEDGLRTRLCASPSAFLSILSRRRISNSIPDFDPHLFQKDETRQNLLNLPSLPMFPFYGLK